MENGSINKLFRNEAKIMLLFLIAPIVIGFSASIFYPILLPFKCSILGGKWASSVEACISKKCAETSSCLSSYNNIITCKKLKLGLSKEELYFQLGMPESVSGNIYTFSGGAGEKNISATIINKKLESLSCGN